jgi:hypothetical protein
MAKQPQDRFQTPAEAARALEELSPRAAPVALLVTAARPLGPPPAVPIQYPVVPALGPMVVIDVPARRSLSLARFRGWLSRGQFLDRLPPWLRGRRRVVLTAAIVLLVVVFAALLLRQFTRGPAETFLADIEPARIAGNVAPPQPDNSGGVGRFIRGSHWENGRSALVGGKPMLHPLLMRLPWEGTIEVTYDLNKRYKLFRVTVAPDDGAAFGWPVRCSVLGDNRLLWESRSIQKPGDQDRCELDVSGVDRLELLVRQTSATTSRLVWVDPVLVKK